MYTTLNEIQKHISKYSWENLLRHLNKTEPDDEPLHLLTVLESNGFEDALWYIEDLYDKKLNLKLAVLFAREVQHLMPEESVQALAVFERYVDGNATEEEFQEARKVAWETSYSAEAARNAVWNATDEEFKEVRKVAGLKDDSAHKTACAAVARAASARAAAYAMCPRDVAYSASNAAYAAAHTDAVDAAVAKFEMQAKQTQILRKFLEETL